MSAANFGVVVTKSNGGSNVSVSIGVNYAYATMPSACCNGDTGMMNQAPVTGNNDRRWIIRSESGLDWIFDQRRG